MDIFKMNQSQANSNPCFSLNKMEKQKKTKSKPKT